MKNVFIISGVIFLILLFFLIHSCKKDKITPPVLTTTAVTEITQTTATSGGNLIEIAGASILSRGVCWNTSANPTVENNKTTESGALGTFTSKITQLTPNTLYYVRAYAISSDVTGYGNQVTFITLQASVPVLTTTAITLISETTARSGGTITNDGGSSISERGVCWNTATSPTIANNKTSDIIFPPNPDGSGTGSFISNLSDLKPGTIYYVRAYAKNSVGTAYGNELVFITSQAAPIVPTLTTTDVTSVTTTTASGGGNITSDGGASVTARGVCWSLATNPTVSDNHTTDGSGSGSFTSSLTGLTAGTTYYVRAYATNSAGTAYGSIFSFSTDQLAVPVLTTTAPSSISQTSATGGGIITSDGGASVTERGVCWSTATNPTTALSTKTTDGSGTGSFTSSITGLTANTTYYIRAYATNSAGTGYGNALSFKTLQESGVTVTDPDGNVYHIVTIGTQVWMVENLKTTKLNDNTSIASVTDATEWGSLSTPGYCWPGNDANNKATYGALYNWYTVNTGKLCPTGWHVPTDAEWTTLTTYLGGESVAGGKLKEAGTTHWLSPNEGATNESGFTAVPGGDRWYNGTFGSIGAGGYWWSSTQHSESFSWYRFMYYLLGYVDRDYHGKEYGHSVRCLQGEGQVLPAVTTSEATAITSTTATTGGNVTYNGGATVTARGVCWSTDTKPTTALSTKTSDGSGTGSFTSSLTGLTANTTYYVRAYATNSTGTSYGTQITFTTSATAPVVPTLSTTAITLITSTTASSGGAITDDGGASVTARGVCWNSSSSPTIALSTKTSDGSGTGSFTSSITGLTANTTYYVRAYATNSAGTAYGSEINFTTSSVAPVVPDLTTTAIGTITSTTASSGGNITSDGGASVTARGVCWNTSANPTTALSTKTSDGTGTGSFTSSLTGLTASTTYYVRAYATNSAGTAYGSELSFTTSTAAPVVPSLSTAEIGSITSTTATSGGNITSDGGASVTARGVCWNTSANPTTALSTKTSDGSGIGSFSSSLTGLTSATTYYVRAYATNSVGTAYGNELTFTAGAVVPTLTTAAISSITSTTASSGGNITNDGGASVSARGVCWSTSASPTIALSTKTSDGSGSGGFSSSITDLTPGTTYYVRAYATSSAGTGYGNQLSFTTTALKPTLTTTAISSITTTTANSGGDITDDGGALISARGVCWSTTTNPTIALSTKTSDGSGSGSFSSILTGLTGNTTYYVRAYATNSGGTGYGNQQIFTTAALIPTLTTTTVTAITTTTASSGGNISSDGGASVTARGVCWSESANPTIALSTKTSDGSGTGSFTSSLDGLAAGKTYHIRAYATNSAGTAYGNELTFSTSIVVPTLSTTAISSITATTAASGGNISSDGGASVSARGVCWSDSPNPTTDLVTKTTDGSGTGSFISSLAGLTHNKTYYVRAYATNSVGTAYGNELTFSTIAAIPTLTTEAIGSITSTTASSGGNITDDGGASVTARGVCWSMSVNPTTALSTKTSDGSGTGSFTSSLTELTPGKKYYVRAYATNSSGTAYGDQLDFTTTAVIPTLTTTAISSITSTTASSGGNITSDGGASVSVRGVCWNTSGDPVTTDSKTTDGSGTGSFTSSLTGLTPGETYYVRAYATNSIGTAYGEEIHFAAFLCGNTFSITHTTGDGVTAVTKTVTYGTVSTALSGAIKCWITKNLGADNQAGSVTDATEASAGWYWQFNRKQGYKHDGTTRTPGTWVDAINESSEWTSANDPCTILLGTGWRIPTNTEWTNVDANGGWGSRDAAYSSVLKIHAAGFLNDATYGELGNRGASGYYWSSKMSTTTQSHALRIMSGTSEVLSTFPKASGLSIRCILD